MFSAAAIGKRTFYCGDCRCLMAPWKTKIPISWVLYPEHFVATFKIQVSVCVCGGGCLWERERPRERKSERGGEYMLFHISAYEICVCWGKGKIKSMQGYLHLFACDLTCKNAFHLLFLRLLILKISFSETAWIGANFSESTWTACYSFWLFHHV